MAAEPHFLFVLTLPYSGSTALAKVLASAHRVALLHQSGEGQWLVPGLCADDRWEPDKVVDWPSVRAVWFRRLQFIAALAGEIDLVIEKSPPNLVRLEQLAEVFPRHSMSWLNRNPYAAVASHLQRRHDPDHLSGEDRAAAVRHLATLWMARSAVLREVRERREVAGFTYEALCADPGREIARLVDLHPALATVDIDAAVGVKDHAPHPLRNHNERQIGLLAAADVDIIGEVLSSDPAVVESFGYAVGVDAPTDS